MFRKVKLTVHELELLVDMVGTSKSAHFKRGDSERVAELQKLQDKLRESIIKEKP